MKNQTIKNERIANSIEIINLALKKNLSLTRASIEKGRGKNYVSNVKLTLVDSVDSKRVSKKDANEFKKAIKAYEKGIMA